MRRVAIFLLVGIAMMGLILPSYAAPKTTTLTFWTFQELHKQFWDDAVVTWNKANPNSQIVLKTDVYNYDEMHNKLLIALQSGVGAPDPETYLYTMPAVIKRSTGIRYMTRTVIPEPKF